MTAAELGMERIAALSKGVINLYHSAPLPIEASRIFHQFVNIVVAFADVHMAIFVR